MSRRSNGRHALLIKDEKLPYNELLIRVKEELRKSGDISKVHTARETRGGELLLTMDESPKHMKGIVEKQIAGAKARVSDTGNKILHIRDLDAVTTREEATEALTTITEGKDLTVKSIRPAYGNTQVVTVEASKETAEELLKRRTVKIGMSVCRVRERIPLSQCRRCLNFGHIASKCREASLGERCYTCGEEGHLSKDCRKPPFCPVCKEGHRAGDRSCGAFRKALRLARESSRCLE